MQAGQPSKPHAGGPQMTRGGVIHVKFPLLTALPPRGGKAELLLTPLKRHLRRRPPELGILGQGAAQLPLHLFGKGGRTASQDAECLALKCD